MPDRPPITVMCPWCKTTQTVAALPATCEKCHRLFNSTGTTPYDGTPRLNPGENH